MKVRINAIYLDEIDQKIEQMKIHFAEGVKLLIYNWSTLTMAIEHKLSSQNIDVYNDIKELIKDGSLENQQEEKEAIEKYLIVDSSKN